MNRLPYIIGMPITESELHQLLESAFPNANIEIKDLAGDNDHWSAIITSDIFEGKNRIEQHRLVQAAVQSHDIHALQIKTQTK